MKNVTQFPVVDNPALKQARLQAANPALMEIATLLRVMDFPEPGRRLIEIYLWAGISEPENFSRIARRMLDDMMERGANE